MTLPGECEVRDMILSTLASPDAHISLSENEITLHASSDSIQLQRQTSLKRRGVVIIAYF